MTNLTKDSNKVTNPHLKKSICLSPLRCGCLLIALVWFALSPVARADSPSNTRLGVQALHGNTTGELNTGIGWRALQEDSTGNGNTAVGPIRPEALTRPSVTGRLLFKQQPASTRLS